jgi:hypothetical protein
MQAVETYSKARYIYSYNQNTQAVRTLEVKGDMQSGNTGRQGTHTIKRHRQSGHTGRQGTHAIRIHRHSGHRKARGTGNQDSQAVRT